MAVARRIAVAAALLICGNAVIADDERAHVNYMLHCQGCHLPEAEGFGSKVPPIKDFVGYFLHSQEGREFLIRVPGVAYSALNDDQVAELMNWLLTTYSANQLPDGFSPFSEAEVAALRVNPENDPDTRRQAILARIAADLPSLADELQPDNN